MLKPMKILKQNNIILRVFAAIFAAAIALTGLPAPAYAEGDTVILGYQAAYGAKLNPFVCTERDLVSVGALLFVIDCTVVLMAGVTIEAEYALYAFISIYVSSKVIDVVMLGLSSDKACYVISSQHEAIKELLIVKLDRGVTVLHAEGGYSGESRPVLLCVVSAQELGRLKAMVRSVDEAAFVFISDAHEVLGEGFRKLAE